MNSIKRVMVFFNCMQWFRNGYHDRIPGGKAVQTVLKRIYDTKGSSKTDA